MKQIAWAGHVLVSLYREGRAGASPGEALAEILDHFDDELHGLGLSLDNAVHHRLWARTREARDGTNDIRAKLIQDKRRCATSSFIDGRKFSSAGDVAMEVIVQAPAATPHRKLVDFTPPRRYAHYIVQDRMLYVSGMAEEGNTLAEQFDRSFAEVRRALAQESAAWADVLQANLFIERKYETPAWLLERFRAAVPVRVPYVDCTAVDALASPGKHLEIEIIAKLNGARR